MGKLEHLEGSLVKKIDKCSENKNVFVIEGFDESEARFMVRFGGRFQAQDESEVGGLRGGGQQGLLEGGEVHHRVHQGVVQDEDIKRRREMSSVLSIFSLWQ